jgi:hypothetical protein
LYFYHDVFNAKIQLFPEFIAELSITSMAVINQRNKVGNEVVRQRCSEAALRDVRRLASGMSGGWPPGCREIRGERMKTRIRPVLIERNQQGKEHRSYRLARFTQIKRRF